MPTCHSSTPSSPWGPSLRPTRCPPAPAPTLAPRWGAPPLPLFHALVPVGPIPEAHELPAGLGADHGTHRRLDGLPVPVGTGFRLAKQDLVDHLGDRLVVTHGSLSFSLHYPFTRVRV